MGKVLLEGFQCERCRHTWLPREKVKDKKEKNEKEQPIICPSCKSPYWNKPKTRNQKTVQTSTEENGFNNNSNSADSIPASASTI